VPVHLSTCLNNTPLPGHLASSNYLKPPSMNLFSYLPACCFLDHIHLSVTVTTIAKDDVDCNIYYIPLQPKVNLTFTLRGGRDSDRFSGWRRVGGGVRRSWNIAPPLPVPIYPQHARKCRYLLRLVVWSTKRLKKAAFCDCVSLNIRSCIFNF
jgi:hypothetical protein